MLKRLKSDDEDTDGVDGRRLAAVARLVTPMDAAGAVPFSSVARLVPHSGVQFIDIDLPTDRLALVQHRFIVETAAPGTDLPDVLVPLPAMSDGDGLEWHPITRAPLKPDDTRWLTGFDGVEAFLDRWVPLPYFRFIGRSNDGDKLRFDGGPTNWARLFIAAPTGNLRTVERLKAVIAFDTRLAADDARTADDGRGYVAPTQNDAQFGSTFLINDEPEDLGEFLGEPWIDQWLTTINAGLTVGHQAPTQPRPKLDHLARYLALLRVLQSSRVMPEIRLVDTTSARFSAAPQGVDLVLDIGDATTTALLIEGGIAGGPTEALDAATPLIMRQLGRPTQVSTGPIPTAVEFDETPFGDAQASRRSGRSNAFLWPSMARIGTEALALQMRDLATPGVTGLTGLKSRLTDTAAHPAQWRIARDGALTAMAGGQPGPVASGPILAHLSEDGRAIGRLLLGSGDGRSTQPALRPRFSQSSMMTQFVSELLLHAVTAINAPFGAQRPDRAVQHRRLERIVVCSAAGAPDLERALLMERTQDALDVVWRSMGWDRADVDSVGHSGVTMVQKPVVVLGLGGDLAAQVVYIHEAIRQNFGNNASDFVRLTRRPCHGNRLAPDLRIAAIDGADDRTNLAVVDYTLPTETAGREGALNPRLAAALIHPVGAHNLCSAIAETIIEPAISAAIQRAGIDDGARFLAEISGPWQLTAPVTDTNFGARFRARVTAPAARALLQAYGRRARTGNLGLGQFGQGIELNLRLENLVHLDSRAHGRLARPAGRSTHRLGATALALMFDAAAERAGAMGLRLADIPIRLRWLDVARAIAEPIDGLVTALNGTIVDQGPDLVLVSGALMAVPDVIERLVATVDLPPARFIDMSNGRFALVDAVGRAHARPDARPPLRPWLTAAIGAYVASLPEVGPGTRSAVHDGASQSTDLVAPRQIVWVPSVSPSNPTGRRGGP